MIRWEPEFVAESSRADETASVPRVIAAVFAAVAQLGARSALLMAVLVVVALTVLFGLTTQDAMAGVGWCRSC